MPSFGRITSITLHLYGAILVSVNSRVGSKRIPLKSRKFLASHLDIGSLVGVPACSFVITRRLYKISRLRDIGPGAKTVRSSSSGDSSYLILDPFRTAQRLHLIYSFVSDSQSWSCVSVSSYDRFPLPATP